MFAPARRCSCPHSAEGFSTVKNGSKGGASTDDSATSAWNVKSDVVFHKGCSSKRWEEWPLPYLLEVPPASSRVRKDVPPC